MINELDSRWFNSEFNTWYLKNDQTSTTYTNSNDQTSDKNTTISDANSYVSQVSDVFEIIKPVQPAAVGTPLIQPLFQPLVQPATIGTPFVQPLVPWIFQHDGENLEDEYEEREEPYNCTNQSVGGLRLGK
jgi:hypothetical protein